VIYGIGTDIVRVTRLQVSLERYGERFAARILAQTELDAFRCSARQAHFLAKRFAAKEAMAKALGTGFRDGLSLRDITVSNDTLGKPELVFSSCLEQRLQTVGVMQGHLSLSDEQEFAVAFVVLESIG
jgi:holo-[acyl-carrier protein] synthase